jgi:signal transduction histidine kinase
VGTWLLVRAAHRARQESLTKTNFVSLVSHELNTPLTAIIPYADMLRKGRLASEEDRQEAYNVIADESVRLKGLVAELLDFSRLERRTKKYTITDFDAAELVRSVVRLMRGRFPDDPPSVSAEGPLPVHADVDAVKAILINLLDNAAKYAPGAPVEVVAEKGGLGVRVEVRDRGPGLSPEGLRNVFTRFWRADDSATASVDGFGLGLTIARSYARDMGGDLTVAAREGGGTVFTLELKEAGNG